MYINAVHIHSQFCVLDWNVKTLLLAMLENVNVYLAFLGINVKLLLCHQVVYIQQKSIL